MVRCALLVIGLVLPVVAAGRQSADRLRPGMSLDAELPGGGVHVYEVELGAGMFFAASFDQRGADVRPVIVGPDGQTLFDYDGSEWGWEPAVAIAPVAGVYRLEARSPSARTASGQYRLQVDAIRTPTPEDEARVRIAALQSEGLAVFVSGRADARTAARDIYAQALEAWQALGDRRGEAHALRVMRMIANALTDYPAELMWSRREADVRRQLNDDYGEAEALLRSAMALGTLGDPDAAFEALQRSIALQRAAGRTGPEADGLTQLSNMTRVAGEFSLALEHGYAALELARRMRDPRREAAALIRIAEVHRELGEIETCLDVLRRAEALDHGRPQYRALALSIMGFAQYSLGDYAEGERLIREAIAIWTKEGNRASQSGAYRFLGDLYLRQNDLERSRAAFEESAALAAEFRLAIGEATSRRRLGEVLVRMRRLDEAARELERALVLARLDLDPIPQAVILADQAQLALARGDSSGARPLAEQSVHLIESVRGRAEGSRVRSGTLTYGYVVYDTLVQVLMAQHAADRTAGYAARALEVSERARARSLLDLTREQQAEPGSAAAEELRLVRRHIQAKARAVDEARRTSLAALPALQQELDELLDRFSIIEARLRREDPAAATMANPEPLSAPEIQRRVLDDDTVLVEYLLADPVSYAWVVSTTSLEAFELPARAVIDRALREFQRTIAVPPSQRGGAVPARDAASRDLSRALLAPLERVAPGKRVLIVVPGVLQQVPFAALRLEGGSGPLLVARHELVYAPSASIVAAVREAAVPRTGAANGVAVFADPVFGADDPRVAARSRPPAADADAPSVLTRAMRGLGPDRSQLARLPFTRLEADAIAALVPRRSLLKATDFDASLERATDASLSRYRILHFATHGLLDTRTPELSGLVFSLVGPDGRPQDGFLRMASVARLRFDADLTVLSGCDTGLGRDAPGEGVIGLTRAFVIAGSRRVVASLWKVDDLATAEFMKRFYEAMLRRNLPPAAALAAAQREMAASSRWRDPFYWAGLVIQGEWR